MGCEDSNRTVGCPLRSKLKFAMMNVLSDTRFTSKKLLFSLESKMNIRIFPRVADGFLCALLLCFFLTTTGCETPPASSEQQGDVYGQMNSIQSCYLQYVMQRKRAPKSPDDLLPLLKQAGLTGPDVFRSSRDGEDFVIFWGVKPNFQSGDNTVIGHEASGSDDQWVVMTSMGVVTMSDAEFKSAKFPTGHSAPTELTDSE
jgi:hypothetical protein